MRELKMMDGVRTGSGEGRILPLESNAKPADGTGGGRSEPHDSCRLGAPRAEASLSRWGGRSGFPAAGRESGGEAIASDPLPGSSPPVRLRGGGAAAPLGREEADALKERQREADAMRAAEIRATMEADRRLAEERIRAIQEDLRTEVFRIWEEVLLRRQKIMNDLFEKWCKILTE